MVRFELTFTSHVNNYTAWKRTPRLEHYYASSMKLTKFQQLNFFFVILNGARGAKAQSCRAVHIVLRGKLQRWQRCDALKSQEKHAKGLIIEQQH